MLILPDLMPRILRLKVEGQQRLIIPGHIVRIHLDKGLPLPQVLFFHPLALCPVAVGMDAIEQARDQHKEHSPQQKPFVHGPKAPPGLPPGQAAKILQIVAHMLKLAHIFRFRGGEIHGAAVRAIGQIRRIIGAAASANYDLVFLAVRLHRSTSSGTFSDVAIIISLCTGEHKILLRMGRMVRKPDRKLRIIERLYFSLIA